MLAAGPCSRGPCRDGGRGLNNYQDLGPIFLIELPYHIPHIFLKMISAMIENFAVHTAPDDIQTPSCTGFTAPALEASARGEVLAFVFPSRASRRIISTLREHESSMHSLSAFAGIVQTGSSVADHPKWSGAQFTQSPLYKPVVHVFWYNDFRRSGLQANEASIQAEFAVQAMHPF